MGPCKLLFSSRYDLSRRQSSLSGILTRLHHLFGGRYLKCIDKFFNSYISCFITGSNVKFLLLHQPLAAPGAPSMGGPTYTSSIPGAAVATPGVAGGSSSTSVAANPTSPQAEEAIRNFFVDVYDAWVKTVMNPFYRVNMEIRSPVFRQRVAASAKKYL